MNDSVWLATATMPRFEAAAGELRADVVVVGGGLIGLTTALLAAQEGAEVVLLEGGRIGARTSGNTTGKVTAQHSLIYADLAKRHGSEKAELYAAANLAGVEEVARLGESIDCELIRAPAYTYTTDPDRAHRIAAEVAATTELGLSALGLDVALADAGEVGLPGVVEAIRFDNQIQLHPGLYLAGLASALVDEGVRVYEHSRVVDVSRKGRVSTEGGAAVDARYAVLATLLPIGMTGGYFARTRPSRSYGIAVQLPEPAPRGMAISIDEQVRSTRPWPGGGPNGLIVVGGSHETGTVEDTQGRYQGLIDWVASTWGVDEVAVEYRWSAQDYNTVDMLPYVGRTPESSAILVATGMRKWGLSNGTAAAMLLRDVIAGRDNPWTELYDARRIGGPRAVAEMVKDNLKVSKAFAAGHLRRTLKGGADHLEVGQGGLLDVDGSTVGAYRDHDGNLHKVSPVCTHMGCALSWNPAESTWDCPCHGSRFTPTGTILDGPATKPLHPR
ncbi:FAD-dependent oxidoreductase [Kribbella sp. NBC_01245]|uniref:FAD-dependent oxidoreductase n=1 Tax=Kribbella sp. NBC_01245 TaxID=2903578 RepID=UPI002E2926E7|nr:FAD-dependent oxidoreductase [Kribbella sp. NBC_01245]